VLEVDVDVCVEALAPVAPLEAYHFAPVGGAVAEYDGDEYNVGSDDFVLLHPVMTATDPSAIAKPTRRLLVLHLIV
jgi:hypothetical protein